VRLIEPTTAPTTNLLPALHASYVEGSAESLLAEPDALAVIAFGEGRVVCSDPRFLRIGLEPLGRPQLEVWRGNAPVSAGRRGAVAWSSDGDYLYFSIEVDESDCGSLNAAAEHAYAEICRFLANFRFADGSDGHLLRLWNHMDAINLGAGDDERYRHFCCGRARGITPAARNGYSAATAIGRRDGVRVLQVHGLAARMPGVAVENPRQVSAWAYPREYGPVAPTFARATRTLAEQLLVSGTAAVVGHRSQHVGDTPAQLDETLLNLDALLAAAGPPISARGLDATLLKIYLRNADDASGVLRTLEQRHPRVPGHMVLLGDICRNDLSIEIDGIQL
jgi:chorismate lyase/3-hydroxybenzoate synthase